MRRVLYFHGINNIIEQHSANGYKDDNSQASGKEYPMHTLVKSHNFKTTTKKFLRYFNPIFQSSRQWLEIKDYLLANLVIIKVLSCRAALSQRPSASELYGNDFLRDYIKVIELARELIDNSKITLRNAIFSFDITLGVSIFSLSRLYREPIVRRQAIELLH
jgi:UDP-glucose 4-epimerase